MTHALNMRWVDLAFLHWRLPVDQLRALVPAPLELDTFEGSAAVGITPFRMTDVRPVFTPPIPTATDFPELNVRTYVTYGGKSGVYFFSLDAASWLAVIGARTATNLPYYHANMAIDPVNTGFSYTSVRDHLNARPAELRAQYKPQGDVFQSVPGSFEYWSTERYSLFVKGHVGGLMRVDIEHPRWQLQKATVAIQLNTMASAARITLPPDPPHVLYSRSLDVIAHLPVRA